MSQSHGKSRGHYQRLDDGFALDAVVTGNRACIRGGHRIALLVENGELA